MPFRWEQNQGGRRVMAVWHFPNYLQNLSLERGLACIVQSWFFCFLLALPSPFQSCADVKGCEVTARGRYWVGAGREAGRRARPGSPCAEFLLPPCCWCCRGFVGDTSLNYRWTATRKRAEAIGKDVPLKGLFSHLPWSLKEKRHMCFEIRKPSVGHSFWNASAFLDSKEGLCI